MWGGVVGPLVGVKFLVSSPQIGFYLTGAVYLIYFILLFLVLSKLTVANPESGKGKVTLQAMNHVLKSDIPLRYFIMGGMVVQFLFCQLTSTLPQYLDKSIVDGALIYSYLLMVNSLIVIVLQLPVSWFVDKMSALSSITLGSLFFAAAYAGFAWFDGWAGLILATVLFTIGEMIIIPSSSVIVDKLAAGEWKATYFGAFQLRFLGTFAGQSIGGALLMSIGGHGLFALMGVIAVLIPLFFTRGTRANSAQSCSISN
ncbi:MFS transporter [Brevibacillus ginsengisoli]|uniref:MFS transporter n=1 Tax=Brevibacillus ginsengisoli TaxID=363854 RepID=UPI003CF1BCBB